MANSNFVVHNGLTVGPTTIDAASGNVSIPVGKMITIGNIILRDNGNGQLACRDITDNNDAIINATLDSGSQTLGNIQIGTNHIESINANGLLSLRPNGTGIITLSSNTVEMGRGGEVSITTGNYWSFGANGNLLLAPNGTGVVKVSGTTASNTYTDGALVVAGGVGIAGNVHIQSGKQFHVGPDLAGSYGNALAQFSANVNSYSQVILQNISNGTSASSDYVVVADTGSDTTNYVDMGINSSNYSDVSYTIGTGLDAYTYSNGGNYAIGTQTSGKALIFHTGGTLSANKRAEIDDQGLSVNTTTATTSISSGALVVNGGCGIAGDLRLGGNLYVTNIISSSTQTITVNDPMLYLTASAPYPYNYDIGFYSAFTGGPANVYAHTGFVRNDTDGAWNLFSNIGEPSGGQISLTNAIYDAVNTGALTIKGDPLVSIVNGGTSGIGNIGAAAGLFNTVFATKLQGVIQTASHPLITTLAGVTSIGASGTTTLTGTLQTAAQASITSVGTLTSLGVSGAITVNSGGAATAIINGSTTGIGNIGSTGDTFNTVFALATSANYADLAENYQADADYAPGTVVHFGGEFEVTACDTDGCTSVAGVVSTNPAHLMNTGLAGANVVAVALTGRVPCQVQGTIRKGDLMVSAGNGRARAEANPRIGSVIGKALANSEGDAIIEVVVGVR